MHIGWGRFRYSVNCTSRPSPEFPRSLHPRRPLRAHLGGLAVVLVCPSSAASSADAEPSSLALAFGRTLNLHTTMISRLLSLSSAEGSLMAWNAQPSGDILLHVQESCRRLPPGRFFLRWSL